MADLTRTFLTQGPAGGNGGGASGNDITTGGAYRVVFREIGSAIDEAANKNDSHSKEIIDQLRALRAQLKADAEKYATTRLGNLPPDIYREFVDVLKTIKGILQSGGAGTGQITGPTTPTTGHPGHTTGNATHQHRQAHRVHDGIHQRGFGEQAFQGRGPIGAAAVGGADALAPGLGIIVKAIQENSEVIRGTYRVIRDLPKELGSGLKTIGNTVKHIHDFLNPRHPLGVISSIEKMALGGAALGAGALGLGALGELGVFGPEVKKKIDEMLDDLDKSLGDAAKKGREELEQKLKDLLMPKLDLPKETETEKYAKDVANALNPNDVFPPGGSPRRSGGRHGPRPRSGVKPLLSTGPGGVLGSNLRVIPKIQPATPKTVPSTPGGIPTPRPRGWTTSDPNDQTAEVEEFQNALKNLPKFAKGGIVDRPTIGLLGEAGPEAVVPLQQAGGMTLLSGGLNTGLPSGSSNKGDVVVGLMRKQTDLLAGILEALTGGRSGFGVSDGIQLASLTTGGGVGGLGGIGGGLPGSGFGAGFPGANPLKSPPYSLPGGRLPGGGFGPGSLGGGFGGRGGGGGVRRGGGGGGRRRSSGGGGGDDTTMPPAQPDLTRGSDVTGDVSKPLSTLSESIQKGGGQVSEQDMPRGPEITPSDTGGGEGAGLSGSAFLKAQRARFAEELRRDPELKKTLAALVEKENMGQGAGQAVAESLFNRMAMMGKSVRFGIYNDGKPSFYNPIRKGEVRWTGTKDQTRALQYIDEALNGSNYAKGHTDQGSCVPGVYCDPNYYKGGEGVNLHKERFNDWDGYKGIAHAREWRQNQQRQVAQGGETKSGTTPTDTTKSTAGGKFEPYVPYTPPPLDTTPADQGGDITPGKERVSKVGNYREGSEAYARLRQAQVEAAKFASQYLPEGYRLEAFSGQRTEGPHGTGAAIDWRIIGPNGQAVPNYQSGANFGLYQALHEDIHKYLTEHYPQLADQHRFGGYFLHGPGNYGVMDLMHGDFAGGESRMAAGNWARGLFPGAAKEQPLFRSVKKTTGGMGDIKKYRYGQGYRRIGLEPGDPSKATASKQPAPDKPAKVTVKSDTTTAAIPLPPGRPPRKEPKPSVGQPTDQPFERSRTTRPASEAKPGEPDYVEPELAKPFPVDPGKRSSPGAKMSMPYVWSDIKASRGISKDILFPTEGLMTQRGKELPPSIAAELRSMHQGKEMPVTEEQFGPGGAFEGQYNPFKDPKYWRDGQFDQRQMAVDWTKNQNLVKTKDFIGSSRPEAPFRGPRGSGPGGGHRPGFIKSSKESTPTESTELPAIDVETTPIEADQPDEKISRPPASETLKADTNIKPQHTPSHHQRNSRKTSHRVARHSHQPNHVQSHNHNRHQAIHHPAHPGRHAHHAGHFRQRQPRHHTHQPNHHTVHSHPVHHSQHPHHSQPHHVRHPSRGHTPIHSDDLNLGVGHPSAGSMHASINDLRMAANEPRTTQRDSGPSPPANMHHGTPEVSEAPQDIAAMFFSGTQYG